jgi:uncharacterized membrane protein
VIKRAFAVACALAWSLAVGMAIAVVATALHI